MDDEDRPDDDFPEVVEIPIEDFIDLHPFRPREIRDVVLDYLECAREKGFREVRLIHGKGIGVQRRIIRSLLEELDFVESFRDGGPGGGEWGATIVTLGIRD
ncbi:MAG: Smr/MutS family protein [Acidobacteria bacterium]|nr:Smr/MutS family protein [Acidobacteriota bacterium]